MKNTAFLFCFLFLYHPVASGTLYDVLGVSKDCSEENLDSAYKRMRGAFHPDRNKAPDAIKRFQEIKEAYDILKNPTLRAKYDAWIETEEYQNQFDNGSSQTEEEPGDENSQTTAQEPEDESNEEATDNESETEANQVTGNTEIHLTIMKQQHLNESNKAHESKIIQMLSALLKRDIDLNTQNSEKSTPLNLAIHNNLPRVAIYLLDRGAKPEIPNKYGNNALHKLSIAMAKYYHDHKYWSHLKDNDKRTLALAKAIIKKGKGTHLLTARNNNGEIPLYLAIYDDITPVAELIIKAGGANNLEEKEYDLLIQMAIKREQTKIVRLLVKKNASSNQPATETNQSSAKNRFTNFFNNFCQTAFGWKKSEQ